MKLQQFEQYKCKFDFLVGNVRCRVVNNEGAIYLLFTWFDRNPISPMSPLLILVAHGLTEQGANSVISWWRKSRDSSGKKNIRPVQEATFPNKSDRRFLFQFYAENLFRINIPIWKRPQFVICIVSINAVSIIVPDLKRNQLET
jgi:hypothetical protein